MIFCRFSDTFYVDQLYMEKKFGWSVSQYTDLLAFYVLMVVVRTFITTPFYCYYLEMHDCMAAIAGILVNMNSLVVTVSFDYFTSTSFSKSNLLSKYLIFKTGFSNKKLASIFFVITYGTWRNRYNAIAIIIIQNGGTV